MGLETTYHRPGRKGVLLVAVGVGEGGQFEVLDGQAAAEETTDAYEQLFTRLWQRGLEKMELLISDGAEAITSAAAIVYPAAAHQLCLVHWFQQRRGTEVPAWQRCKLRRELVALGDRQRGASAEMGGPLLPPLAVLGAGDGGEVIGGVVARASLLALPDGLATTLAHDELSGRPFQTPAAVPGPLPRLHR